MNASTASPADVRAFNAVIAARVRTARDALGWSQRELSRQCGVSKAEVNRIERGVHSPSALNLACIAGAMGKTPGWFFGEGEGEDQ